ncbi:MAG TPA: bifunctional diguanylate cyclase/phosphodiesterase [Trebonia sp.]|nr:bifunctional diguanylate cyclase/phosphodiesterase [Trebonia sp.]
MALLVAVYYVRSGLRVEAWGLISLSGVAAILTGLRLNHPARKVPWLLLAAALASFAAGQLSFLIAAKIKVVLPFPSFADVLYLLCYPLGAAGLLIFIYWRTPDGDRRSLIDALTLTAGLALLSYTFLIRPYVHNPDLSTLQKFVAVAYPLGDVLLLGLLARLLAPGTIRTRSVQLLTVGFVCCLLSDTAFTAVQLHSTFHSGTLIDLGWALYYSALGAAALHPSMTRLTEPVPRQQVEVSPARLALLMLASLIAPVVLLTALPGGATSDVSVIAVFSAILYLLVLTRLWDAAASHRRALDRERVLRHTGLSLVTMADVPQVAGAVQGAVGALLGMHAQGDALLGVRIDGLLRVVDESTDDPAEGRRLGQLAETWLSLVHGPAPTLTPMQRLPEQARTARPGAEWMLLCPLSLQDRPFGDTVIGLIAAFGEKRALSDLSATLEILAQQVALTLESVMLRQEAIRQRNEAYFRALVQDASDAIVIVADDGIVKYATPSTTAIFGDVPAEGEHLWDLVAEEDREDLARTFMRLRERARFGPRVVEKQTTRRDGTSVHLQARCSDLRAEPNVAGLVFTLRDVTAQHKLEEELKHRAFHDALTGLPNRLLFQDRIAQRVGAAARDGSIAGVLFVDLDDFKVVNDTKGHSIGDELLVAVAARLSSLVRDSDTAARLGGDEFALLIGFAEDTAAVEAVEAAAERIVGAFAEPFALSAGLITTSVTVGVATTEDSTDTEELLRHADLALYAAKAAGKRRWRRYQPVLSAGLIRRREIQEALEEAVNRSAFSLVYQPIVALDTGELAGFEALIRWPHPQWGMMHPGQFITLAEETGQIIAIGAWVLRRATADIMRCRQAAETPPLPRPADAPGEPPPQLNGQFDGNRPGRRRNLYVSVNVSARQFADTGFADTVRQVLATSGLESQALMLELTESVLLRRDERLHADLEELKGIGVKLAIDDFGTGYSSLSYLRDLPMDVVKMDRSFVEGIADSDQRLALAEGIVQIARTLSLEVVAEGIETEVQRDLLSSMGCHYGQGYLLAMPMPAREAVELVRNGFPAAPFVPEPRALT